MSTDTVSPAAPARAPMDPRLVARRVEIARQEGRRRLHRLLVILAFVTVAVTVGVALRSPLLDVDTVAVTGAPRTGNALVRRTAGIPHRRAMVSVNPAAAEARLERLPWVADAHVGRRWPATVTVRVVERRPVATLGAGRGALGVDHAGLVLGSVGSGYRDRVLPVLAGPPVQVGAAVDPARRSVVATLSALPEELRREVVAAATGRGGSTFVLAEGITVRWGDRRRARAKTEALRTILRQPGRDAIATIDVTVPSAAAVTGKTATDR